MASAGKSEQEQLLHAVDEAWNHGIMVVTAAGNNGPKENSVTIPGISRKVLTVGSWDDNVTETGNSGRLTKKLQRFWTNGMLYCEAGSACTGNQCKKLQQRCEGIRGKKRYLHGSSGGVRSDRTRIPETSGLYAGRYEIKTL